MQRILLTICCLLLLLACRKDEESISSTTQVPVFTPPGVTLNGSVVGSVSSLSGNSLGGVPILLNNHQVLSNQEGSFRFDNVPLNSMGALLRVNDPQYWHTSKRVIPKLNELHHAHMLLAPKALTAAYSNAEGYESNSLEGLSLSIPAYGVIRPNGEAYTGEVSLYSSHFPATDHHHIDLLPGGLQGIDANQEHVSLLSFGYFAVDMVSNAGQLITAAEVPASFGFPVEALAGIAYPQEAPVWGYNEATGYWHECGTATFTGGRYEGLLCSGATFIGVMLPQKQLKLELQLLTPAGTALANTPYRIQGPLSGLFSGSSTNSGEVLALVPSGVPLHLIIYDPCGEAMYTQAIGELMDDAILEPLVVESAKVVHIQGALSCNGVPVAGAAIQACASGICMELQSDVTGAFEASFTTCGAQDIVLQISHPSQNDFTLNTTTAEAAQLGEINMCESEPPPLPDEYIQFNFLGTTRLFQDVVHTPFFGGTFNHNIRTATDSTYTIFELRLNSIWPGSYNGAELVDFYYINSFPSAPDFQSSTCDFNGCNSLAVTITSLGTIGEYIEGTFSGNLFMNSVPDGHQDYTTISGAFRVMRTI